MFNTYTIKKILPKLIIAAVGVNLSWYIAVGMLDIANIVGEATREVLLAPFSGLNTDVIASISGGGQTAIIGLLLAGGIAMLYSSFAIFTPILVGGLLALFIGYVALVLRQGFIVMTILLSPLIIAAWVFPGTEGVAKKAVGFYIKLLVMYPLIMALLVSGRIFSAVFNSSTDDVLPKVLSLVALFAPYFMIPFTLKFAGGAMSKIAGFANDRSRGVVDGLRKRGAQKSAENRSKMLAGSRYSEGGRLGIGRAVNNFGARTGAGTKGRFGFGERGRQKLDQNLRLAAGEAAQSKEFSAIKDDDGYALQALTYSNYDEAVNGLQRDWGATHEQAVRSARAVQAGPGFSRRNAIAAAQQLVVTGTGYNDVVHEDGSTTTAQQQLARTIARVSNGNADTVANLAGFANATTKKVGRGDLAPGFGNLRSLSLGEMNHPEGNSTQEAYNEAALEAARGQDVVTLLRDKGPGYTRTAEALQERLNYHVAQASAGGAGWEDHRNEAMRINGLIEQHDSQRVYASDNNQQALHNLVENTQADRNQLQTLIRMSPDSAQLQAQQARYGSARVGDPNDPRNQRPPVEDQDQTP